MPCTLTHTHMHARTHTHTHTRQWGKDAERSFCPLTPALQPGRGSGPQVFPLDESTQALPPQDMSAQSFPWARPGVSVAGQAVSAALCIRAQ